ncbi:hypothetical protein M9458_000362, partial [Cirrhinus mrigala]
LGVRLWPVCFIISSCLRSAGCCWRGFSSTGWLCWCFTPHSNVSTCIWWDTESRSSSSSSVPAQIQRDTAPVH